MNIVDKILNCENKYIECFCKATKEQDYTRYQDDLIPDMYYHNYTRINSIKNESRLAKIIDFEIAYSKNIGKDYCLIRCLDEVKDSVLTQLSCKPEEMSKAGYYVFDFACLSRLNKKIECSILKVNKPEMLEDMLYIDLEHDEEYLGKDFCTRRLYRRKDIYLSDKSVNAYICYDNDKIIGSCDMFIYEDIAKIEDFSVVSHKQRKGYGTAILKTLIEIALKKNVTVVYLETDDDGTAKEMYNKLGFSKVNEITDLIFKF